MDYMDYMVSKWWKIRNFSKFLAHPVETPWPILTAEGAEKWGVLSPPLPFSRLPPLPSPTPPPPLPLEVGPFKSS